MIAPEPILRARRYARRKGVISIRPRWARRLRANTLLGAPGKVRITYRQVGVYAPTGEYIHGSPDEVLAAFVARDFPLPAFLAFAGGTTETFTTTGAGTWKCRNTTDDHFNVTAIAIEVFAGGAGGGTANAVAGPGGGGGGAAYSLKTSLTVTPSTNYSYNVGVGGVSQTNGGDSWMSDTGVAPTSLTNGALAKGGTKGANGGTGAPGAGGAGGQASAGFGDTKFSGGTGGTGSATQPGGGGGGAGDAANGSNGAANSGGGGGATGGGTGGVAGGNGSTLGGGGSGATLTATTTPGIGARGQLAINYLRAWVSAPSETITSATDGGSANLLSADESGFETSSASYTGGGGTVARSTAQAHSGSACLAVTKTGGAGSVNTACPHKTGVAAGDIVVLSGWVRSAVTARTGFPQVAFYTSGDVVIGSATFGSTTIIDSTSAWTSFTMTATAPATAAKVAGAFVWQSCANNEVHYLDDVTLSITGVTRQLVMARSVSETVTGASDSPTRVYNASRTVSESITAANDAAPVRALAQARSVTETVTSASDSPARALVQARTVSESITSANDGPTRVYNAARTVTETVASSADSVTRQAQFNRSIAESIATAVDTVARQLAQARTVVESIAAASDTVARLIQFNRTVTETISSGGGGVTTITPIFVFDD